MVKQSVTITEEDRDLLKLISMGNPKYKGKVSTGIKMLCNIYRSVVLADIKKRRRSNEK